MSRSHRRAARAGFTLVELTVAMVAGLIVALGIVGLSRAATKTFNEEIRSSAAESALRTALDRLRGDLQRAAFMSTGNVASDNMINKPVTSTDNLPKVPKGFRGLRSLSAIQVIYGGSLAQNTIPQSALQPVYPLAPDILQIGGNMTSAEQFDVAVIMPPAGNCQQIMLSPVSASIYRVASAGINTPAGSQQLSNIFAPVSTGGATNQFMVRLLDNQGCSQYLATCPGMQNPAGITNGQPFVWVDAINTPIVTAQQGVQTTCSLSGYAAGTAWVNPVQIVRWEIMSTKDEQTSMPQVVNALGNILQGNNGSTANIDTLKYDLVRSFVDAATELPIPASAEVVAEYAVDLKIGLTVDNTNYTVQQNPNLVTFSFDDGGIGANAWAMDVSTLNPPPASPPTLQGPQRIRAVRARIVTRTAMADRTSFIDIPNGQYPSGGGGNQAFIYRYCINPAGCALGGTQATEQWARARTATTEVTLFNNATWTY